MSTASQSPTEQSSIRVRQRATGRWWRWPRNLVIAFYAAAGFIALHRPVPTTEVESPAIIAPIPFEARAEGNQQSAQPAKTATLKFSDTPWGTRIYQQRECRGIDDCIEANIELEQTEASRMLNRLSRTSPRKAIELLGKPHYVLRSGDHVPVEYYEDNSTERGSAQAIIMWSNGPCAPNSMHVSSNNGQVLASPDTGGSECTIDGKPFPMPTEAFSCEKGRKSDPLCKLDNVLQLPML